MSSANLEAKGVQKASWPWSYGLKRPAAASREVLQCHDTRTETLTIVEDDLRQQLGVAACHTSITFVSYTTLRAQIFGGQPRHDHRTPVGHCR